MRAIRRRRKSLIFRFARYLLFANCSFLVISFGIFAQTPAASKSVNPFDAAVDALVKKVSPSIVQINVPAYAPLGDEGRGNPRAVIGRQRGNGSGFVIDPDGYTIINAYVVNGALRVRAVLPPTNPDGHSIRTVPSALNCKFSLMPSLRPNCPPPFPSTHRLLADGILEAE